MKRNDNPQEEETKMSAAVETMMFAGETPWHGLGNKVDDKITIADAIDASGLNWEVGLKAIQTVDGEALPEKATYRVSDGRIFSVVGPRYVPLQNKDAFDWFQPFLDAGECNLHTAGSLHNGEKVWVLAQLNRDCSEIVGDDTVCKFILLSNSHNGTTAIRVGYTPIRVVCANTMAMAHSKDSGSQLIRIRHTRSQKVNLEKVRDIMDNINVQFEATAEQYRFLASKNFSARDIDAYVKVVLGVEKTPIEDISTRTKNIIADIMTRIEGPRQSLPGVKGTWWAAYNGVNEYLNYAKGRNADNRIDSLWFGQGANDNSDAFTSALEFANAL
jgi:phage/plasmid-like protein (TIGR03299 family)